MRSIVLIGFCYEEVNNLTITPLPGILIDLYQVYEYCKKISWDKLIIITDVYKITNNTLLNHAILKGVVHLNVLLFLEEIKPFHQIYFDQADMLDKIRNSICNSDEILVYYTGHSKNNYLNLPISSSGISRIDGLKIDMTKIDKPISNTILDTISVEDFKNLFLQKNPTSILFIMDCCSGIGLGLPFQLIDDMYRLTDFPTHKFHKTKIICLSSAMHDESAIASHSGSVFTRVLFKHLPMLSLSKLLLLLKKDCHFSQTSTIHSNYPNCKHLFNWLLPNNNKLQIEIDEISRLVKIRRK